MATKVATQSGVLLGLAVALALQIPTSIQAIPDATWRAAAQVLTLVIVVVCSIFVKPDEVKTAVMNSLRPPSLPETVHIVLPQSSEPSTIRPPKPRPASDPPDTPAETPSAKNRAAPK